MSFKLNGEFNVTAPQSVLPSTDVVDYSGVGNTMAKVGQVLDRHDARMDVEADAEAAKIEDAAMARYEPERKMREVGYTGEAAGYSADEIAAYDQSTAEFRQMALPQRVQKALTARLDARRLKVSDNAIAWEAARRGAVEGEKRASLEQADDARVMMELMPVVTGGVKAVHDGWDGKSKGYADAVAAAYDAGINPVLEGLDEAQRRRLQPALLAQKNAVYAQALKAESAGMDAFILRTANETANVAINMVSADPANFQTAGFLLDKASSALPAQVREVYRKEGAQGLTMARVEALIRTGDIDGAKTVLKDAQGVLEADDYRRGTAAIERGIEHKRATDYVGQAAMENRMTAYIDGVVAGDTRGERPTDAEVAATFGEKGLFEFRQKEKQAKAVKANLGDFGDLSEPEMARRVEALRVKAEAGGADYQINQALYQSATKMAANEVKKRRADTALWAASGDGAGAVVRHFWTASETVAPGRDRQLARRTYVEASGARQREAGIATPQILPRDRAKAMATAYGKASPEQRGDALIALHADVYDWGASRGQVIGELKAVGLDGSTGLVLAEFDNPLMVGAYAQGGEAYKGMKPKEKTALTDRVAGEIKLFDQTVYGGMAAVKGDRHAAIAQTAAGFMAQGDSEDQAVRKAVGVYKDQYAFVGTYRVPKGLAEARPEGYSFGKAAAGTSRNTKLDAIKDGTSSIAKGLIKTEGSMSANMGDDVNRRNLVSASGRWVTRPQEDGLMLVVPDAVSGQWVTVRDKAGKVLSFTWGDLEKRGQAAYAAGSE